jgi:hypothetical protein
VMKKPMLSKASILGAVELGLFGVSLFFLIPPVVSNTDELPSLIIPRMLAIIAFALSRVITAVRKVRPIAYCVGEVALFWLFSWALFERLQIP